MQTATKCTVMRTALISTLLALSCGVGYTIISSQDVALDSAVVQSWATEAASSELKKQPLITMNVAGQTYVKEYGSVPPPKR